MLRDFDHRVLFQMSSADSTSLVDTTIGSKLGLHRALYYREETGVAEKFRPYSLPDSSWLSETCRRLQSRLQATG